MKKDRFFHALPCKILLALVPGDFLSALSFLNPSYTMATSPSTFSSWGEYQAHFAKVQGFPYCLGIGVPLTPPSPLPRTVRSYPSPVKLLTLCLEVIQDASYIALQLRLHCAGTKLLQGLLITMRL